MRQIEAVRNEEECIPRMSELCRHLRFMGSLLCLMVRSRLGQIVTSLRHVEAIERPLMDLEADYVDFGTY